MKALVIVAHPDDETLWAGGTILLHPESQWTIVTLCRKSDSDRAPRFFQALEQLKANGAMGDLDDGPEQFALAAQEVRNTILELLPPSSAEASLSPRRRGAGFDLVITHGPAGEYTRHIRHEETGKAVVELWEGQNLEASEIWRFAYEDGGGKYLPRPARNADLKIRLPEKIWRKKYDIITRVYGFGTDSFEARAAPREEAFRCYKQAATRKQAHRH